VSGDTTCNGKKILWAGLSLEIGSRTARHAARVVADLFTLTVGRVYKRRCAEQTCKRRRRGHGDNAIRTCSHGCFGTLCCQMNEIHNF
jgi:hypothetical protein